MWSFDEPLSVKVLRIRVDLVRLALALETLGAHLRIPS